MSTRKRPPKSVTNFKVTRNVATITFSWNEPTQRVGGAALKPTELKGTTISLSSDNGATFTALGTVSPAANQTLTGTYAPGNYVGRAVVVDLQNPAKSSTPVDVKFTIPPVTLAAPNPVTNFTVSVT